MGMTIEGGAYILMTLGGYSGPSNSGVSTSPPEGPPFIYDQTKKKWTLSRKHIAFAVLVTLNIIFTIFAGIWDYINDDATFVLAIGILALVTLYKLCEMMFMSYNPFKWIIRGYLLELGYRHFTTSEVTEMKEWLTANNMKYYFIDLPHKFSTMPKFYFKDKEDMLHFVLRFA